MRRKDLLISSCDISVQEEIDQGALKDGSFTRIHRKSSTGDLHAGFKVDQSVGFGQLPMGLVLFSRSFCFSPAFGFHIVRFARALGYTFVRHVGDMAQFFGQRLLGLCEFLMEDFFLCLERGCPGFGLFCLFFFSGLEEPSYFFGQDAGFVQGVVQFFLRALSNIVLLEDFLQF